MTRKKSAKVIVVAILAQVALLGAGLPAWGQQPKEPYPTMAPVDQYLMERGAEIALARSAAPASISGGAEVLVLTRQGYDVAEKGSNGFVCMVERGWTAPIDDPDFWNPKNRAPMCLNPQAAQSSLPITLLKTKLVMAGQSKAQMFQAVGAAFEQKQLPPLESGAMVYMLSKQQYLGDQNAHWHPHVMFLVPLTAAKDWGANLPGSPIFAFDDPQARITTFLIPVGKWSDGSSAMSEK